MKSLIFLALMAISITAGAQFENNTCDTRSYWGNDLNTNFNNNSVVLSGGFWDGGLNNNNLSLRFNWQGRQASFGIQVAAGTRFNRWNVVSSNNQFTFQGYDLNGYLYQEDFYPFGQCGHWQTFAVTRYQTSSVWCQDAIGRLYPCYATVPYVTYEQRWVWDY